MLLCVFVVVVVVACIFAFVFFPRGSKGAEQIDTALYSLSIFLGNKFVPLLKLLEKIRATFLAIGQCRMQAEVQIFQAT